MSVTVGLGKLEEAREIQTRRKLDRIEQALRDYRDQYSRLPCPGQRSLVPGNAGYGSESQYAGYCYFGIPTTDINYLYWDPDEWPGADDFQSWHIVAEGSLPFKTLGLPEEFMFDGWGRLITYAVNARMTEIDGFKSYDMYERCPGIEVRDAGGTARTTRAVYALISHGSNGHGAFTRAGTRYNDSSADASEQLNCNCDATATFDASYESVYVQKGIKAGGTVYDDMMRYRERWQLQNEEDRKVLPYVGPEIMVGMSVSPWVDFYSQSCNTFTNMANPASLPSSAPNAIAVSPDNNYWAAVGAFTPKIYIYKRNSSTGAVVKLADPASLPDDTANDVGFVYTLDGNYMAVAQNKNAAGDDLALRIYKIDTSLDTFTYLDPGAGDGPNVQLETNGTHLAFHPGGKHLAVTSAAADSVDGYYLKVYERTTDTFTAVDTDIFFNSDGPDPQAITAIAWSPDGRYLAVGYAASPYIDIFLADAGVASVWKTDMWEVGTKPAAGIRGISFDSYTHYMVLTTTAASSAVRFYYFDPIINYINLISTTGSSSTAGVSYATALSRRQPYMVSASHMAGSSGKYGRFFNYSNVSLDPLTPSPLPSQPAGTVSSVAMRYRLRSP